MNCGTGHAWNYHIRKEYNVGTMVNYYPSPAQCNVDKLPVSSAVCQIVPCNIDWFGKGKEEMKVLMSSLKAGVHIDRVARQSCKKQIYPFLRDRWVLSMLRVDLNFKQPRSICKVDQSCRNGYFYVSCSFAGKTIDVSNADGKGIKVPQNPTFIFLHGVKRQIIFGERVDYLYFNVQAGLWFRKDYISCDTGL